MRKGSMTPDGQMPQIKVDVLSPSLFQVMWDFAEVTREEEETQWEYTFVNTSEKLEGVPPGLKQVAWTAMGKSEGEVIQLVTELALEMDNQISLAAVKKHLRTVADLSTDEAINENQDLLPAWRPGMPMYGASNEDHPQTIFIYPADGRCYKALSDHTAAWHWKPDEAVSLYSKIPEPGTIPEWSSFASHEFQHMAIGTAVMDEGTKYYLINPAQGHWKPSGAHGHHGWSTTQP